jgi:hypothetical protein
MRGIKNFVEYYKEMNKKEEGVTINFCVSVGRFDEDLWMRPIDFATLETIRLDQEDLDYLYNKYLPAYKTAVEEELKETNERKQQEITELEQKLDKLKNEILDNI